MKIFAISISDRKGIRKNNIRSARLVENFGLEDDAHGGKWHRQISFLAQESIEKMRVKGLDVVAGNFAENITTQGIDLTSLAVGDHLKLGGAEVVISQRGKVCHHKCAIYYQAGDCVMPREGIFAVVKKGGLIRVGDPLIKLGQHSCSAALIAGKAVEQQDSELLEELILQKWSPAFVRFDQLNGTEDNVQVILDDLIRYQHISRIILFDPAGRHQIALFDRAGEPESGRQCKKEQSLLHYCRSIDEIRELE